VQLTTVFIEIGTETEQPSSRIRISCV